jgi:hypothetical protein
MTWSVVRNDIPVREDVALDGTNFHLVAGK